MEYISITIERDDLAERLGGGLPKGSLMIIEGPDGTGKSVLSQRIIYGALVNGHTVSYVSTELNTLDFIRQMASLEYDIAPFLLDKKLSFITLLPYFSKVKEERNLIFKLRKGKKLFDNEIFVLDSLSPLLVSQDITYNEVYDLIEFFNLIKHKDKLIILTYNPEELPEIFVKELRRVSDIYFELGFTTLAGQRIRYLNIKRFRNAMDTYSPMIPFRVEPRLGFIVEIVSVV